MGNCIDIQKPVTWVDDDGDDVDEDEWEPRSQHGKKKAQANAGAETCFSAAKEKEAPLGTSEIKIKISKKQLEKLLQQVDGEGLPLQQVLRDLVSLEEAYRIVHQDDDQERHWRPKLQSIPETAE